MLNIDLTGKRALVTGANSGIGEAVALALAEAGASVAINYISRPEDAERVAAKVRDHGGKALAIKADISDAEQVAAMFATIDREWDGIDILVNNAGIDGARALGWEADITRWRQVIDVNLVGAFQCCREAMRRMVANKSGVVLNMSSVHEMIPWSGYTAYAASKAGLSMLTKTLALEAAPHGVRVLAIAPGAIKTPINSSVWGNPTQLADLNDKIPMARMGTPPEIARMAVVLASDVASYATGSTVYIDGGMTNFADFAHGG